MEIEQQSYIVNNKLHPIFPTLVFEDYYEDNQKFLNTICKTWSDHYTDGYTNELTGDNDLHLDIRYKDLYTHMTKSIQKYLHTSGIMYENFDINFVKSWFNSLDSATTPLHSHADAHISIVYYVNTPEDAKQDIRFFSFDKDRQAFEGLFAYNSYEYNQFNGLIYNIQTYQGQIVIFPARLPHDTYGDGKVSGALEMPVTDVQGLLKKRICIASDVVLTYKEKQIKSGGIQPVKNWRTFNE